MDGAAGWVRHGNLFKRRRSAENHGADDRRTCGRGKARRRTKKTKIEQVAPLTARARAILLDIRADKKSGAIVPNAKGLLFTRDDGRPITKDMIQSQVEKAIKATGVKKFTFHNYRNTALTEWARRGINVDVAMKASGHGSVQMHKRYVDLQEHDVATAFGTAELATGMATEKRASYRK